MEGGSGGSNNYAGGFLHLRTCTHRIKKNREPANATTGSCFGLCGLHQCGVAPGVNQQPAGVAPGVNQQLLADHQLQPFLFSYTRQASGLI